MEAWRGQFQLAARPTAHLGVMVAGSNRKPCCIPWYCRMLPAMAENR